MFAINNMNNGTLSFEKAMPQKDSTSDGTSSFATGRRLFTDTLPISTNINQVNLTPVSGINSNRYTSSNGITYDISASSVFSAGEQPYNIFDDNINTIWHPIANSPAVPYNSSGVYTGCTIGGITYYFTTTIQGVGVVAGEWVQIKSSSPFILKSYTYRQRTSFDPKQCPRVYYIVGSDDGRTWFPVDYRVVALATDTPLTVPYSFTVNSSTTAYTYYRMVITNIYANGAVPTLASWNLTGDLITYTPLNISYIHPTKKWVGGSRDSSQNTRNKRVASVGNGSLNASGIPMSMTTVRDINTTYDAKTRVRAGGASVPSKVRNRPRLY